MNHSDTHRTTTPIKLLPLALLLAAAVFVSHWLNGSTAQAQDGPISPLICFAASNVPGEGILLAWRSDLAEADAFTLARAQFTSPLGELRGPLVPEERLPQISERTQEADGETETWRYLQVDQSVADGVKYAYVITATFTISDEQQIAVDEETWTYNADEDTAPRNDKICLSTNDIVWTPTPTPTITPTLTPLPPDTATPTRTPTPTWTPTSTWTPTPTATHTPLPPPPFPTKTPFPFPTPTWTDAPTEIPPTPTTPPTPTITPTFTPFVGVPTPLPGAGIDPALQQQQIQQDPAFNSNLPTPTWTPEWTPTWTPVVMESPTGGESAVAAPAANEPPMSPTTLNNSPLPTAQVAADGSGTANIEAAPFGAEAVAITEAENTSPTAVSIAAVPPVRSEFAPTPPAPNRFAGMRIALFTVIVVSVVAALAFLLGFTALFGNDKQRRE